MTSEGIKMVHDQPADGTAIEYVVVSYLQEIELLRLQMRSIARYHAPEGLRRIHVINNDRDSAGFAAAFQERVRPELGRFADLASLVDAELLLPGAFDASRTQTQMGWNRQQALKLLAHQLVTTQLYVTLDTKNALIRPCSAKDYLTPEGRIIVSRRRRWPVAIRSFAYLGLDQSKVPEFVSQIMTPYTLMTGAVAALCNHLHAGEVDFRTLFADADDGIFEYTLYHAWLAKTGQLQRYDLDAPPLGLLFRPNSGAGLDELEQRLLLADRLNFRWFGFHRVIGHAAQPLRDRVASWWQELGLTTSQEEGLAILRSAAGTTRRIKEA